MSPKLPHFLEFTDWERFSYQFPVQYKKIWFNFSGTTPISHFARRILNEYYDEYSELGVYSKRFTSSAIKEAILQHLGEWVNAPAENFGLTHNTAEGMNLFSHSISLKSGSRILIMENEYPSNVYPWEHWASKGVHIAFVPLGDTPEEFTANFNAEIEKGDVALVSISPVHWCTGMPIQMEILSKTIKKHKAVFVLDASQGIGNIALDFTKLDPDFAVFAAWKWLLGPVGLAGVYLSPRFSKDFRIIFKGTASVLDDEKYLPYRDEWKTGADQFEFSTASVTDWVYFFASLRMLSDLGIETVMNRKEEIVQKIYAMLKNLGFDTDKDRFIKHSTSILTISGHSKKQFSPESLASFLRGQGIFTTVRLGRVRIAPHIPVIERHVVQFEKSLSQFLTET